MITESYCLASFTISGSLAISPSIEKTPSTMISLLVSFSLLSTNSRFSMSL